ncbi:MAG: 1,4-alpha-glucan branching protein [Phycisphaerae bacterium]|nr:1,4-alpha-glucan branching protein [Phycisphaerae bacterium]
MAQSSRPGQGATVYQDDGGWGTTFRTWAPNAAAVYVSGSFNNWATNTHPLTSEGDGFWSRDAEGVWAGHEYQFVLLNSGNTLWRNDPRARKLTSSNGKSIIVNPDQYSWQHDMATPNWNELVIYELHAGTFGTVDGGGFPGNFAGVQTHLDHLADLGINAVELLPVNEFAGDQSWGYNPGHIFSVESYYGGPDQLKQLVDACHERGIAVLIDVVFNHLGPTDLGCWQFDGWSENDGGGIYFYNDERANTPWGDTRPDFGRDEVRQFLRDASIQWLDEYHVDGLRVDGTRWIEWTDVGNNPDGWSWMQWLNDELNTLYPGKLIIAEDMSDNHWITKPTSQGGAGFNAQWDPWFVHPIREVVENAEDDWRNMWDVKDAITFAYNGNPFQRVLYTESHDEVANGRSRVPEAIWPGNADSWYSKKRSTLAAGVIFTSPGIPMIFQGQEFLEDGWFTDSEPLDWGRAAENTGITALYRDLISLRLNKQGNTRGLTGENVNVHHVNDWDKVVAWHRWADGGIGDDVIVLANFRNQTWDDYRIGLPDEGLWKIRFNSDWQAYDAGYDGHPCDEVIAEAIPWDGMPYSASFKFGAYTMAIFSQSPPCLMDIDGDGDVNVDEVLLVIASWGTPDADVTGDGQTDVNDLLAIIGAFGACP